MYESYLNCIHDEVSSKLMKSVVEVLVTGRKFSSFDCFLFKKKYFLCFQTNILSVCLEPQLLAQQLTHIELVSPIMYLYGSVY